MNKISIILALIGLNLSLLGTLLYFSIQSRNQKEAHKKHLEVQKRYNYDDLMPSIIYSKDDKVDTIFREVSDIKN